MNSNNPRKVVILLSDKRSGSTLFQKELIQHIGINTVDFSPHAYLETHFWTKAAKILISQPPNQIDNSINRASVSKNERRILNSYGSSKNALKYLIQTLEGNGIEWHNKNPKDSAKLKEFIFEGWEQLCEKFSHPVFFEKSPQILASPIALNLLHEWMQQTQFDVKIIVLVRNPMSIMYSAEKLFYTDPEKRQFGWIELMQNLELFLKKIDHNQSLIIRYEDLIQHPVSQFKTVCQFIGVEYIPELGNLSHRNSIEKWRTDDSFDFQLCTDGVELAMKYGYNLNEIDNSSKKPAGKLIKRKRRFRGFLLVFVHRLMNRFIKPLTLNGKKEYDK
jgi:hypothetical protein